MATSDFGLSYTVSAPALWVDNQQGKLGEHSTIFADIVSLDKLGESSNISARGLGCLRSVLASPLRSTLSGPVRNILFTPCSPFLVGLEGYYIFDGDGLDYSGSGRDLTFGGIETYSAAGQIGESYNLAGIVGRFAIDSTNDPVFTFAGAGTQFAISLWAAETSATAGRQLIQKMEGPGGTFGWRIFTNAGGWVWQAIGNRTIALNPISAGFHHIVVTSDGATEKIYFDGIEVSSVPADTIGATTNALRIGNHFEFGDTLVFNGRIDEVALWSRPLTDNEVTIIYNNGVGLRFI